MNNLTRIFLTIIINIILASTLGCSSHSSDKLHQFETPEFVNAWPSDNCALPCWYGIVPGKTPLNEARNILSSIPELNYIEPFTESKGLGEVIRFDVTGGSYRIIAGSLTYDSDDQIIDKIQYFAGDSISLRDVVEAVGEPAYFTARATNYDDSQYAYEIQLFFPDEGILLDWGGVLEQNKRLTLDPNQRSLNITFLAPNLIKDVFSDSNQLLQTWEGFVQLETACKSKICQLTIVLNQNYLFQNWYLDMSILAKLDRRFSRTII